MTRADSPPTGETTASTTAAVLRGSSLGTLGRRVLGQQEAVVFAVLLALLAGFTVAKPDNFANAGNLQNLARDAAVLLILSVGITYVTVMGMFDLSIGSVLVF